MTASVQHESVGVREEGLGEGKRSVAPPDAKET